MKRTPEIVSVFALTILAALPLWFFSHSSQEIPLDTKRAHIVDTAKYLPPVPHGGGRFVVPNAVSPDLKWIAREEWPQGVGSDPAKLVLVVRRWPDGKKVCQLSESIGSQDMKWSHDSKTLFCPTQSGATIFTDIGQAKPKRRDIFFQLRENGAIHYPDGPNVWIFLRSNKMARAFWHERNIRFEVLDLKSGTSRFFTPSAPALRSFKPENNRFSCAVAPLGNQILAAVVLRSMRGSQLMVFDLASNALLWERFFAEGASVQAQFSSNATTLVLTETPRKISFQNRLVTTAEGFDFVDARTGSIRFLGQSQSGWSQFDRNESFIYTDDRGDVLWLRENTQKIRFIRVPEATESPTVEVNLKKFAGFTVANADFVTPHGDGKVWILDSDKGVKPVRREDLGRFEKPWFERWR